MVEENAKLRLLLVDAALRISEHHAAHLCAWEGEKCPVCCDDLFERMDAAMGKPANDKLRHSAPAEDSDNTKNV